MKPKAASRKVEAELLKRIDGTKFDRSGLRIHHSPLAREEYDFRGIEVWEAESVAICEYQRDIKRYYDAARELVTGDLASLKKRPHGPFHPSPLADDPLFPVPSMELRRIMGPGKKPISERITAIREVDQDWFDRVTGEDPDLSFHRLRIDWRQGREIIKRDLGKWIDELGKNRKTIQRRAKARVIEDRLDQLAAWRAHRAGLNHAKFTQLSPRIPYSDATAFRRAHEKAEKLLRSFL